MRERKGCLQACTCATTAALHAGHMLCQPAAHEQRPAPPRCFGHMLVSEAATSACAAPASGGAQMARSLHQSSRGRRPGDVVGYGRLRPRRASSRAARVRPRRRRRSVSQTRLWLVITASSSGDQEKTPQVAHLRIPRCSCRDLSERRSTAVVLGYNAHSGPLVPDGRSRATRGGRMFGG